MFEYIQAVSSYAGDIDGLIWLITFLVGFWFLLAEGVFIWFIIRFRAKDGRKAEYVTGDEKHQKKWIAIPHYLVLVCDLFIIAGAVRVWYDVKQTLPQPDETVRVTAQQWAWIFQHPGPDKQLDTADDIRLVNELRLRVDTTYVYELASRDVLHSFSVPCFRLKQDAIPGRIVKGWFRAEQEGEWDIQCAEMCGIGHGLMPARVVIESPEAHAAWMNESPTRFAALR